MIETIVFDVGETLVRDDRYWASWADWLGVPRHTVSALIGAATVQNKGDADALRLIKPGMDIGAANRAREAAGRGEHLDESDLYPDVRPALAGLQALGIRVVLAGNQTVKSGDLLRRLDLPVDLVATSAEWGVAKPDPEFFEHVIEVGRAEAGRTVFLGRRAGLRTAHLRRGPWGYLWADDPEVVEAADWRIDSLTQLTSIAATIAPD
ncbi:HAD family hydrolase [Streptomyces odonnellii]|uniref:HAD family hydrolase n=1 Tax=Streptomyces odonnellii TaxID=1417980 RepID=UPI000A5E0C79|nr:HAD family hydrolase [Streptomyces odonnellii]